MTDQIILGIAVTAVALLIAYEVVETWRWRGFDNRPPSRFRVLRLVRVAIGGLISIVTLRRWRGAPAAGVPTPVSDNAIRLLDEGQSGPRHLQPGRIVVSGARMPIQQDVEPVRPIPQLRSARPSRLRLVRDTLGAALIMGGFVVVFANLMPVRPQGDVQGLTATPAETSRVVIVPPLQPSDSPATIESPASGITATPTPALVSSTPSPTLIPAPGAAPTAPPQPTAAPTRAPTAPPRPTPRPTPKPTKQPTPTPAPTPVIVQFVADQTSLPLTGGTVQFSISTTNATDYDINFDDGSSGTGTIPAGGTVILNHDYGILLPPAINPTLVVLGPGGSDIKSVTINVP